MILISCGNVDSIQEVANINLPTLAKQENRSIVNEVDIIKSSTNQASWGYYRDGTQKRWYISAVTSNKSNIYSLMEIRNGSAGWGTVGINVAAMNLANENVTIDYIANNSECRYYDAGWQSYNTDCLIQSDIEKIRNSTTKIDWWFFKNTTTNAWYIIDKSGNVYKFASKEDGQYDWQSIDMGGAVPSFYVENSKKYFKYETAELPQLDLKSKNELTEIYKNDCKFTDVYSSDWFYKYVTPLCQAGIIQGYPTSYTQYKPAQYAKLEEIFKVATLSYDYQKVKDYCTTSSYENTSNWYNCYFDFMATKGVYKSKSLAENFVRRGEAMQMFVKLFWNKDMSTDEAGQFLFKHGVINGEGGNGIIDYKYLNTYMNRAEMAKVILNASKIADVEQGNTSKVKAELPYAVIPVEKDNNELPTIESSSTGSIKTYSSRCMNILLDNPYATCASNGSFETILPDSSSPKAPSSDLPRAEIRDKVAQNAQDAIGERAPYVDNNSTNEVGFVRMMYGKSAEYETAKDLCADYKAKGKLKEALPTAVNKGALICYNEDTPGTDGNGYVAIKKEGDAVTEIGVQSSNLPVTERTMDAKNIEGYINAEDFALPSF